MMACPTDQAWHPQPGPGYVEWWYVDAIFTTRDVLSGSLGLWGSLKEPAAMTVRSDFMLWRPGGAVLDLAGAVPFADFQASTADCDVRLGPHHLRRQDGQFFLTLVNAGQDCRLELEFRPHCPGFNYRHDFAGSDGAFWWAVAAPRAQVTGRLVDTAGETALDGVGYHDHNWSSISITKMFAGWQWGRLHAAEGTLVWACVFGPGRAVPLFQAAYWWDEATATPHLAFLRDQPRPPGVGERCTGFRLNADELMVDLTLTQPLSLARRSARYTYGRFLAHGEAIIRTPLCRRAISGPALHEIQQFTPVSDL